MASKHRLWAKVFAKSFAASTLVRVIDSSIQTQALANTQCEGAPSPRSPINPRARLSRKIEGSDHVEHHYKVDWKNPLGQGSFGIVYLGTDRVSQERVAVKKVSVKHQEIMDEVQTMAHVADTGGHPNICGLRDYFRDRWYHYLVVDLIEGYEMFDHLVSQGAYSEAEAARLMREVASALAYLHGLDVTHGDLKPENLMLSTRNSSDAVVKLIDFGCATMIDQPKSKTSWQGQTLAYCPPEVLLRESPTGTMAADMWAIGVILYIMLTGIHPFDISGRATDDQVVALIKGKKTPPIRNTPITAHLSESAIDLIEKLMDPDPAQRMAAEQMLEHPWTRGLTARRDIMVDSDKRLSVYRNYKSGIAEKVFENIVTWSDEHDSDDLASRTSLIERAFRAFDPEQKGYLTQEDLKSVAPAGSENEQHKEHQYDSTLSLSDFSNLLSENIMKDRYFSKGTVVYREGQIGNSMYFINSGKVTVETKAGTCVQRGPGDFFGEGALFHPKKLRSVSITCETPVHAIEISREYFEKYVTPEKSELLLTLREKDKIRKRNRAKMTLKLQKTLAERIFSENDMVFQRGQPGDSIFIVKSGRVDVLENGKRVFTAKPDNVFGEFAVVTGRPRNSTAICADDECVIHELSGADFRALTKSHSEISTAIRDLCWRRDFKKAVVLQLQKEFPYDNPREAFDAIKRKDSGEDTLDFKAVANLMRRLNPECSDDEISEIIRVVDLTNTGYITFDEFKKVFIAHIRKSASV